jgi:hypothetical protein
MLVIGLVPPLLLCVGFFFKPNFQVAFPFELRFLKIDSNLWQLAIQASLLHDQPCSSIVFSIQICPKEVASIGGIDMMCHQYLTFLIIIYIIDQM